MNPKIKKINQTIEPYKKDIIRHPLYKKLNSVDDIAMLMEHHVYAVWDFMSLLKALQSILTCTSIPWRPVGDTKIRRLINSILLEEESDVDSDGKANSHYEMYLDAMQQCGANTDAIKKFVANISTSTVPKVGSGIDDFLDCTFNIIKTKKAHKIAAAFTFGREDLIPDMFTAIVKEYNQENRLDKFLYYLERHIELDGGDHGPLALKLISDLCGDNESMWRDVEEVAISCLIARKKLWDHISSKI